MQHNPAIINFRTISDQLAIGGQPTIQQFQALKDGGFSVIFQLIVKEANYPVNNETYHVKRLKLKHRKLGLSVEEPTVTDFHQFTTIMNAHKMEKTFVHCAIGYCTSGLLTLYLMQRDNLTLEQVQSQVLPDWQPTPVWQALIHTLKLA